MTRWDKSQAVQLATSRVVAELNETGRRSDQLENKLINQAMRRGLTDVVGDLVLIRMRRKTSENDVRRSVAATQISRLLAGRQQRAQSNKR